MTWSSVDLPREFSISLHVARFYLNIKCTRKLFTRGSKRHIPRFRGNGIVEFLKNESFSKIFSQ